jgi:hypothetical protein
MAGVREREGGVTVASPCARGGSTGGDGVGGIASEGGSGKMASEGTILASGVQK